MIKNEFFNSYNAMKGTLLRTVIYTLGHIVIAMACNAFITGADWGLAAADALIEPCINGVWYFMLDSIWASKTINVKQWGKS